MFLLHLVLIVERRARVSTTFSLAPPIMLLVSLVDETADAAAQRNLCGCGRWETAKGSLSSGAPAKLLAGWCCPLVCS